MPCGKEKQTTKKCAKSSSENLKTLADIIKDYQETCSEKAYEAKRNLNPENPDLSIFMHNDLHETRELQADPKGIFKRCVCNRKRHQYCIPENAVNIAAKELMKEKDILPHSSFNKSFEVLYDKVKARIGNIHGIGNSTLYDACIRLGWTFEKKIEPTNYVYVHRKLIESAEAIFGNAKYNIVKGTDRPAILWQEFINTEPEFKKLSALDIENLLCIYHDDILRVNGIEPKKEENT